MDADDLGEDVDLMLRHVARQFPRAFAAGLLPVGAAITSAVWLDSQVTARQRRLDRALEVTVGGRRRHEHTEWQLKMEADVPYRIFEYHTMLAAAVAGESGRAGRAPPIRSTLVLLTGRERRWPREGEYRTSPADAPFSGVTFRIDAVYQRSVKELVRRGSALWLAFAPLAVDADARSLEGVLELLRAKVPEIAERCELVALMLVLATVDQRRRGLRQVIVSLLREESVMKNWIYKEGEMKGREEGREEGRAEGARRAFVVFYQARFGEMPAEVRARVEAVEDVAVAERWCDLVARGSQQDVDAVVAAG